MIYRLILLCYFLHIIRKYNVLSDIKTCHPGQALKEPVKNSKISRIKTEKAVDILPLVC